VRYLKHSCSQRWLKTKVAQNKGSSSKQRGSKQRWLKTINNSLSSWLLYMRKTIGLCYQGAPRGLKLCIPLNTVYICVCVSTCVRVYACVYLCITGMQCTRACVFARVCSGRKILSRTVFNTLSDQITVTAKYKTQHIY